MCIQFPSTSQPQSPNTTTSQTILSTSTHPNPSNYLSLPLTPSSLFNKPINLSLATSNPESLSLLLLPSTSHAPSHPQLNSHTSPPIPSSPSSEPLPPHLASETLICSPSRQAPQVLCEQFQHSNVYETGTWQMCWLWQIYISGLRGNGVWWVWMWVDKGWIHTHVHGCVVCAKKSSLLRLSCS